MQREEKATGQRGALLKTTLKEKNLKAKSIKCTEVKYCGAIVPFFDSLIASFSSLSASVKGDRLWNKIKITTLLSK
jgi:hypothetical protein